MARYGRDLGCRYGQPHQFRIIKDTERAKWEVCEICNVRKRYNKREKGRSNNREYLKDHLRNFCQQTGSTRRIYNKIYRKERMAIHL